MFTLPCAQLLGDPAFEADTAKHAFRPPTVQGSSLRILEAGTNAAQRAKVPTTFRPISFRLWVPGYFQDLAGQHLIRRTTESVPNGPTQNLPVNLCRMMHTSFVSNTDRAIASLSGVNWVLIRPSFRAPDSISISLSCNLVRPEGLYVIPWLSPKLPTGLWLNPGWCVDNLKREDEMSRLGLFIFKKKKKSSWCTSSQV